VISVMAAAAGIPLPELFQRAIQEGTSRGPGRVNQETGWPVRHPV
jgi:hypothetical protein